MHVTPPSSESRIAVLASYLPRTQLRSIAARREPLTAPANQTVDAAVMVTDVCGFARLTEELNDDGPHGAETLTEVLNTCFSALIDRVYEHGGDVIEIEGDAVIATWAAGRDCDIDEATRRAAQCAIACMDTVHGTEPLPGVEIRIRSSLSCGPMHLMHVGGNKAKWRFVVAGNAMVDVALGCGFANPGEVLVSPQAEEHVGEHKGATLSNGFRRIDQIQAFDPTDFERSHEPIEVPAKLEGDIRLNVLAAVATRVDAGQHDWIAESRAVSVLFVNFPRLTCETAAERLTLHQCVSDIQREIERYDGTFLQLLMGDKGCVAMCAFGVPPRSHEDDAARAGNAAIALRAKLAQRAVQYGIGIATGRAFCGAYGNSSRRQYSVIGDVVNTAARLMQLADNDVLTDANTASAARAALEFEALSSVRVKGRRSKVKVRRPRRRLVTGDVSERRANRSLLGRADEQRRLKEHIEDYIASEASCYIVLEGDAGIGKSFLLDETAQLLRAHDRSPYIGIGLGVEASTAYYAWRPIFRRLLRLKESEAVATATERIEAMIAELPGRFEGWTPLLNAVLPFEMPDTIETAQMPTLVRAESTRSLLSAVVRFCAAPSDRTFVFDDGHWIDSVSWSLIADLMIEAEGIFIAIGTRPFDVRSTHPLRRMLADPASMHVDVGVMGEADLKLLVRDRLGATKVPAAVDDLIVLRSEGHPLFAEELVVSLLESNVIEVVGHECRLVGDDESLAMVSVPDTVEGVITSRLDRLSAPQQLAAKVASVIGRVFEYRVVDAIYPVDDDRDRLAHVYERLREARLTEVEIPKPELAFIFKHVIIQQVAYGRLALAQRKQLHARIALYLHEHLAEAGASLYPLLAHHYQNAEDYPRCIDFLEKAGGAALSRGANSEALRFFSEALRLTDAHDALLGPLVPRLRRARWEKQAAEALNSLGDIHGSTQHYRRALELIGKPFVPNAKGSWARRLARELSSQAMHLTCPPSLWRSPDADEDLRRSMAAEILGVMSEHLYYEMDIPGWFAATLASVNYAEKAGDQTSGGRAYGGLGYLVGLMRMRKLGLHYTGRGRGGADVRSQANAFYGEALIYLGFGEWDDCLRNLEQGNAIAARVGDVYSQGVGMIVQALAYDYMGDTTRSIATAETNINNSRSLHNILHRCWALIDSAATLANGDELGRAVEQLAEAERLLDAADNASVVRFAGIAALVYLRLDDRVRARREAERLLKLYNDGTPAVFSQLWPYQGMCEVFLDAWERGDATAKQPSKDAVAAMGKFSAAFPIGKPRHHILLGRIDAIEGDRRSAAKRYERAMRVAVKVRTPQDVGLAQLGLAHLEAAASAKRLEHLRRARAVFVRHGWAWQVRLIDAELEG